MSVAVSYTSRKEIEVHKFGWAVSAGVPLLALFIQVFFPVFIQVFFHIGLPSMMIFDLPLLVTIYFAVARRRPIPGLLTGAMIGTVQDALTRVDIGLNGMALTIVGYLASSLGVKLDVENPGSRFLMTIAFFWIREIVRTVINVMLVGVHIPWDWPRLLVSALANAFLAVVLFMGLDRLKLRV